MSSPPPSRSNNYTAGTDTPLTAATWNGVLNDIAARITAAEAVRANFQALIDTGVGGAMAVIAEDISPLIVAVNAQIATLNSDLTLALNQINTMLSGGGVPVFGPPSSTDGHIALFSGTTGKLIEDGGAAPVAATSSVLGLVKPDGTTIANTSGAISVAYGTAANTAAAGNDTRIAGALPAAGGTMSGALDWSTAVSISSAATVNIGAAASNYVIISGTTTITAFDIIAQGAMRWVQFSGALTLTYNVSSLIFPGGVNYTTTAGDVFCFVSEGGGNWRCVDYALISGRALVYNIPGRVLLATLTASSSASLSDTTHITSAYNAYEFIFRALKPSTTAVLQTTVSTNGGSSYLSSGYVNRISPTVSAYFGMFVIGSLYEFTNWSDPLSGSVLFSNPNSGISYGAPMSGFLSSTTWPVGACCANSTTSVINAIKFAPSTGTFTSGSIEIWGIL
jgi:hypothetical protein